MNPFKWIADMKKARKEKQMKKQFQPFLTKHFTAMALEATELYWQQYSKEYAWLTQPDPIDTLPAEHQELARSLRASYNGNKRTGLSLMHMANLQLNTPLSEEIIQEHNKIEPAAPIMPYACVVVQYQDHDPQIGILMRDDDSRAAVVRINKDSLSRGLLNNYVMIRRPTDEEIEAFIPAIIALLVGSCYRKGIYYTFNYMLEQ